MYNGKQGECDAIHYAKSKRQFKVRLCEHLGFSYLTNTKVWVNESYLTAIQELYSFCNHCSPLHEDIFNLTTEMTLKVTIMKGSLLSNVMYLFLIN